MCNSFFNVNKREAELRVKVNIDTTTLNTTFSNF